MPSGPLHSPRRSRRPALRLLATLLLALALAEPAYAESFGAEELREAEAVLAAGGVEAPEVSGPEVAVPEVAVPDVAVTEVVVPDVTADVPDTVEAVEVPNQALTESVEPPPEASLAPAAEAPPARAAGRPAVLGARDRAEDLGATPPERVTKVEQAATEAVALMREEVGAQLADLGAAVTSMKREVSWLDEGFDWTMNWSSGCGGAPAAGLQSNWTLDGACLPQNLRGHWLGGDRPLEDRLGGLLEALLPEGMSLGEAVGGLERPSADPLGHRSEPRRSQAAADAASDLGPGSVLASPGRGGLAELPLASAGDAGASRPTTSTAGGASGPEPARDPASAPPEPPALAAGLAPGTGGGGGGAAFVLLIAALVGGLALVPPPSAERAHARARRLRSLISSSRRERPG
jgi:hypothetical protein